MISITYTKGDATSPHGAGAKIIAHISNDQGGWDKGFVVAISKRWPKPEAEYRSWHRARNANDFAWGAVQVVQVEPRIWVANMIGQHGMKTGSQGPPIRYDALDQCLSRLADEAKRLVASVHMPRIGCGLAGGKWERVSR